MVEARNAQVHSTMLGFEGHGIFSFMIYLSYGEHASQGFGGYVLGPGTEKFIQEVLKTVGVEKWEDLKGKYVRVELHDGLIVGLGHVLEDKWFYPKIFFEKLKVEKHK